MTLERLEQWMTGTLTDDELTLDEVKDLELRVMGAIERKMIDRSDLMTFQEHKTLQ